MKYAMLAAMVLVVYAGSAVAQAVPANGNEPVHAMCKDGTEFEGKTLKGACHGHGGVDKSAHPAAAAAPASTPAAAAPAPAPMPAAAASPAPAHAMSAPAAGGGAGQVWVNDETKVYHCMGDHDYGKTKKGHYTTEADAHAQGDRPSHGKTCAH